MRRTDIAISYDMLNEFVNLENIEGFVRQKIVIDGTPSRRDFDRRLDEVMGDAIKTLIKEPITSHINIKTLNENRIGDKLSIQVDYSYSIDWQLEGIKEQYLSALLWYAIRAIRKLTCEWNLDVSEPPPLSKWSQERFTPIKNLLVKGETYVVSERVANLLRSMTHEPTPRNDPKLMYNIEPYQGSYLIVDQRATDDYVMHLPKTTLWVSKQVNLMMVGERSCVFGHDQVIDPHIEYPVTKIIGM